MYLFQKKWFVICFIMAVLLFSGLFWTKFKTSEHITGLPETAANKTMKTSFNHETWKSLFIKDEKAGYSVSKLSATDTGYFIEDKIFFRFNFMGLVQTITMENSAKLKHDFSMHSFSLNIHSSLLNFSASGNIDNSFMKIRIKTAGSNKNKYSIQLKTPPYLTSGILLDLASKKFRPGKTYQYFMFDPATMEFLPATAQVKGFETIDFKGISTDAMEMVISFKGLSQTIWTDKNGRVLKEAGMLGMKLVACSRKKALSGITKNPTWDMTRIASVKVDKPLKNPTALKELVIELSNFDLSSYALETRRQTLTGNQLSIKKESITLHKKNSSHFKTEQFLSSTPFIQSDNPLIINLARSIVKNTNSDIKKIKKLVLWVYENIKKKPSPHIPDALATLKTRRGDCNEHAVLLAALGRAVGIPSRIETGLYYLDGRFMYHAWNAFHTGEWITADSVFNQIPADVTHVRISSSNKAAGTGVTGILGKIKIKIIDSR